MNPKTKKWLIAGVIGVVSIAGALAYLQYRRIMNYTIKFKRLAINKVSATLVDINIFLLLENKSNVTYTINSQEYSVYINDKFVTKLENKLPNEVKANSFSEIGLNVKFNPSDILSKSSAGSLLGSVLSPENTTIKIDMKLKVSLYGINVSIPYTYITNMKELTSAKQSS